MKQEEKILDLQIGEYIKNFGGPLSISLLDPRCLIFKAPGINGAIGYCKIGKNTVVFGDPVASFEDKIKLGTAFHDYNSQNGCNSIYLAASVDFSEWAMQNISKSLIEVQEELAIDPATYPRTGPKGRLLHKKTNHAKRDGVKIQEFLNDDPEIKKHILEVEEQWLKSKKGPQIYISHINFFEEHSGKRCFYATVNDQFVGAIFLSRMEAENGWLLYLLTSLPNSPVGTSEYLILTVLDKLAEENCHYFSFGISTIEDIGKTVGLKSTSLFLAKYGFKAFKKLLPLDNRRKFWEKFDPYYKRSFTLFSDSVGLSQIYAIMKTTNVSF